MIYCLIVLDVLYVALEYLPNGDLRTYLRGARPQEGVGQSSLSEAKLLQFAADVAKGMQHVAASGVSPNHILSTVIFAISLLVLCSVIGFLEYNILYLSTTTESDNLCLLHIDWTFKE